MKKLIFFIFLLTTSHLFAQNKWEYLTQLEGFVPKFAFSDTNNGYLSSTNGSRNWLYSTTNKGQTWIQLKKDFDFTDARSARHISAPDSNIVYIGFLLGGFFYRSFDGGITMEKKDIDSVVQIEGFAMATKNIGVLSRHGNIFVTTDGWETIKKCQNQDIIYNYIFNHPSFINDSTAIFSFYEYNFDSLNIKKLIRININTMDYEIHTIHNFMKEGGITDISDLCIINENTYIVCGKTNSLQGGSGQDIIYKTTDGGRNWRCVLDLYSWKKYFNKEPFGVQSIDFKDSLVGIAVGQFGKIVYTYDGGESWVYEETLPEEVIGSATNAIIYAGSTPIISNYNITLYRMVEDHLAPKPTDTTMICGRVTFEGVGQAKIPVIIGNRVTMTDSLGYYKFTQLPAGTYSVKAVNKFYDIGGPSHKQYYMPYIYSPDSIVVAVSDKVCDVDFTASDNRKYCTVSGYVKDSSGNAKANVKITLDTIETTTNQSGYFRFDNVETHLYYTFRPASDEYTFKPERVYVKPYRDSILETFIAYPLTSISVPEQKLAMLSQAGNTIYVAENVLLSDCTLTISDLSGRELLRTAAKPEQSIMGFPRGTYIATLRCGSNILESLKVMKE